MTTPQRLGLIRIVVGVATAVMVLTTWRPIPVLGRLALMVALVFVFVFLFVFVFALVGIGRAIVSARLVGVNGNQRHYGIECLGRFGLS